MQKLIFSLAASACFAALLGAAHAQNFDTFVSGDGNDGNGCISPLDACREISAAIAKTDAFGVVHVLPGAYFSGITVDKTLDIIAEGGSAAVRASVAVPGGGNAGIVVNADEIVVRIRGIEVHTANGGIALRGGGNILYVEDCVLVPDAGASEYGIDFRPTGGANELYVSDTVVAASGNGALGGGIRITPSGSGSSKVVLNNTLVENNVSGILIDGRTTTGSNTVTIRDSTVAGGATQGINAIDSGGGTTGVMIEGSTVSNNGSQGVVANGANVTVRVRNSTLTGNGRGVQAATGAQIISHGGNVVAGNTVNGAFTSSVGQQ